MNKNNMPITTELTHQEAKDFELLPEDTYVLQILNIEEREEPSYDDKTVLETKLNFSFVILDEEHRGRRLWRSVTPVISEKSILLKLVQATVGKTLTQEEQDAFNAEALNSLIGSQVRGVVGVTGTGKSNKIVTFQPIKEELEAFDAGETV